MKKIITDTAKINAYNEIIIDALRMIKYLKSIPVVCGKHRGILFNGIEYSKDVIYHARQWLNGFNLQN